MVKAHTVKAHTEETKIHVHVCACTAPGHVCEVSLVLAQGCTLADALHASGLSIAHEAACGVWGQLAPRHRVLHTGDRVEVYRALTVDPKMARRQRFARQGARTAGLFARRRTGGKAGY